MKFSENRWMNDGSTAVYLHSILGSLSFSKRLLVWDAYKCHTSEANRRETTRLKLHTAIVPGGCTKFIQAPDVVWNSCFKSHLRRSYDTWLSEPSVHEYTKGGNMKPPSHSLLCEWIKEAWSSISEETIITHSAPVLSQPIQMEVTMITSTALRLANLVKPGGVSC